METKSLQQLNKFVTDTKNSLDADVNYLITLLASHNLESLLISKIVNKYSNYVNRGFEHLDSISRAISSEFLFNSKIPYRSRTIFVIGPQGSGKSLLINNLTQQLVQNFRMNVEVVHLVPGSFAEEAILKIDSCNYLKFIEVPEEMVADKSICSFINQDHFERMLVVPSIITEDRFKQFNQLSSDILFNRVSITHTDFGSCYGKILNHIWKQSLQLAFFNGEDNLSGQVEPASINRLSWFLREVIH